MTIARANYSITLVRAIYDLFMGIVHVPVCKLSVLFEIQYDSYCYLFERDNDDLNLKVVGTTPRFQQHVTGNRCRYWIEFRGK